MSPTNQNASSTIVPALEAMASELPHGRRRREIRQLAQSLQDPNSLTTTDMTSTSEISNIDAWLPVFSQSLATPSAAIRLSDWMEQASRESHIRNRLRRALLYPVAVLCLAMLVFFGLGQLVISPFSEMFDEFGLNLPGPTMFVIFWVKQWQDHTVRFLVYVLLVALITYIAFLFWTRHALTTRLFGFFIGGSTANVAAMASFTGLLADLLASGRPLPDSLELAGRGCGHAHFKNSALRLAQFHRRGLYRLSQSPDAKSFPRNLIDAVEPIDGSAPRTTLLRELAAIYGERAIERTEWSAGLVGAITVFIVGLVIGFVVIALFMPLVSLISGLA